MLWLASYSSTILLFVFVPYLALPAHALSVEVTNGSSTKVLPAVQGTAKAIFMEGGQIVTLNSSASVAPPAPIHASVKKRILSEPAPPPPPEPAPVVEENVPPLVNSSASNSNATTAKSVPSPSLDKPLPVTNITSTSGPQLASSTSSNQSSSSSSGQKEPVKKNKEIPVLLQVNSTAATTIKTTTASTTTPTTTTAKPKKPKITVSLNDDPGIIHVPSIKTIDHTPVFRNNLDVEEPIAQLSRENLSDDDRRTRNSRRDLVIPVVSLIFTVPMLLGLITVVVRRFRDYMQTRHYRRMDFLVDGIYND